MFSKDSEIIDFILKNKENRRKTLLNLRKQFVLIGAKYQFLIDRSPENNQINLIYDRADHNKLKAIYQFNREINKSNIIEVS
jgi:hypothetical protein